MIVGMVFCLLAVAALIVAISFTAIAKSGEKLSGRTTGKIVDITYTPRYFNGESNSPTDGAAIILYIVAAVLLLFGVMLMIIL